MKTFDFKGYDATGKVARGLIEALDLKNAREKLADRGVLAERVALVGESGAPRPWRIKKQAFNSNARAAFYREISALLKAGLPLAQSLEILIDAPETGVNRAVLAAMRDQIRDGAAFTTALKQHAAEVRPYELAAVDVGERAGTLDRVLDRLAGFMEEQEALKERIQTALIYPSVVLMLTILVAVLMLGVMLPRFAAMFADTQLALPFLTRMVLASGQYVLAGAVLLPVIVLCLLYLARARGRRDRDWAVRMNARCLAFPVVGRAYTALVNLRFARTLALLLEGGVSLVEGLPLAGRATGSICVGVQAEQQADALRHGSSLADAVRRIPALSGSLPGWIQAGEASGNLEGLLEQAAIRYQQAWERMIARSMEMLEPLLIIIIGALVLVLALAVLLPVLSLNNALS